MANSKIFDDVVLAEAYKQYKRCRIVAEMFGCSDETVRRALIKLDIPRIERNKRPTTPKRITENQLKEIVNDYYSSDLTINELSAKYHRSQKTISDGILKYGHGYKYCERNSKKITDEQLQEEAKIFDVRTIALTHGMSESNVVRRAKRIGVCIKTVGSGGKWEQRAERYGVEFDKSITLAKVRAKFNDICQICGKPVNEKDILNGHIRRYYPTLDHIIPISKGGSHTWDNVQLAHMCCNAGKCDKVI